MDQTKLDQFIAETTNKFDQFLLSMTKEQDIVKHFDMRALEFFRQKGKTFLEQSLRQLAKEMSKDVGMEKYTQRDKSGFCKQCGDVLFMCECKKE